MMELITNIDDLKGKTIVRSQISECGYNLLLVFEDESFSVVKAGYMISDRGYPFPEKLSLMTEMSPLKRLEFGVATHEEYIDLLKEAREKDEEEKEELKKGSLKKEDVLKVEVVEKKKTFSEMIRGK